MKKKEYRESFLEIVNLEDADIIAEVSKSSEEIYDDPTHEEGGY